MTVRAVIAVAAKYKSDQIRDLPAVLTDQKRIRDLFIACGIEISKELRNPSRTELLSTLRRACQEAAPEDDLILYFSGHGQAYLGRDYLVPVDAAIDDFKIVDQFLVPVDLFGVLQEAQAASVTMIIDACREGIELDTKSVDFSSWAYQEIGSKTVNISIVFSCGHGEYSHVITSEYGSLFTSSFCDAVRDRSYGEGTLKNVFDATQQYIDRNARDYKKPPQKIVVKAARRQEEPDGPILFPPGKQILLEGPQGSVTGWHRHCDFLWPAYTRIYDAWNAGHKGSGISIAQVSETVFDAHVELRHATISKLRISDAGTEELAVDRKQAGAEHSADLVEFGETWRKLEGYLHGRGASAATGIAGILTGTNVGICPDSAIINLGIFDEGTKSVLMSRLLRGLDQIYRLTEKHERLIALVCVGGPRSSALESVVGSIAERVLVIAPSGNAPEQGILSPASLPGVLSVGAVDRRLNIAPFSDYRRYRHAEPDIYGLAGGLVPSSSAAFEYEPSQGTSAAAAYVAGIAALVWAANPAMDPKAVRAHLIASAAQLPDKTAQAGLAVAEWRVAPTAASRRITRSHQQTAQAAPAGVEAAPKDRRGRPAR